MSFLIDTNILLRIAQPSHLMHAPATQAVTRLLARNETVFFCAQNIPEFRNVATRPVSVNGLGLSHEEAWAEVLHIGGLLTLLLDSPDIYPEWKRLIRSQGTRHQTPASSR
jgi:predicted nucleic acid-binding protein